MKSTLSEKVQGARRESRDGLGARLLFYLRWGVGTLAAAYAMLWIVVGIIWAPAYIGGWNIAPRGVEIDRYIYPSEDGRVEARVIHWDVGALGFRHVLTLAERGELGPGESVMRLTYSTDRSFYWKSNDCLAVEFKLPRRRDPGAKPRKRPELIRVGDRDVRIEWVEQD